MYGEDRVQEKDCSFSVNYAYSRARNYGFDHEWVKDCVALNLSLGPVDL
jgi:hypothetical protein